MRFRLHTAIAPERSRPRNSCTLSSDIRLARQYNIRATLVVDTVFPVTVVNHTWIVNRTIRLITFNRKGLKILRDFDLESLAEQVIISFARHTDQIVLVVLQVMEQRFIVCRNTHRSVGCNFEEPLGSIVLTRCNLIPLPRIVRLRTRNFSGHKILRSKIRQSSVPRHTKRFCAR